MKERPASQGVPLSADRSSSRTYKWYNGKPVFEFGYGLHYTNFSTSIAKDALPAAFATKALTSNAAAAKHLDLLPFVSLPVSVKNIGSVSSDFVVLAFLKGEYGPKPYPNKSLVGFTRLRDIAAGATATAAINIELGTIARSDEKGNLVLWPGSYSIVLDVDGKEGWSFTITGDQVTLDQMPPRPS